jgi:outer membrane protein OmpA-like peptidoglycan-associated protein
MIHGHISILLLIKPIFSRLNITIATSYSPHTLTQQYYEGAMNMKLNKIHFLEKFVLATFPVALAVGCTTTANHSDKLSLLNETVIGQEHLVEQDGNPSILQTYAEGAHSESPFISVNSASTSSKLENDQGESMQLEASTMAMENIEQQIVIEETTSNSKKEDFLDVQTTEIPAQGIFYFDVNKHSLSESDVETLKQHAKYLQRNIDKILYVDGFSDNRGPANLNYQLSKKRAHQVANVLIEHGAPESHVKINGYGESFPLSSEMNYDENRRVELEYANIGTAGDFYAGLK